MPNASAPSPLPSPYPAPSPRPPPLPATPAATPLPISLFRIRSDYELLNAEAGGADKAEAGCWKDVCCGDSTAGPGRARLLRSDKFIVLKESESRAHKLTNCSSIESAELRYSSSVDEQNKNQFSPIKRVGRIDKRGLRIFSARSRCFIKFWIGILSAFQCNQIRTVERQIK